MKRVLHTSLVKIIVGLAVCILAVLGVQLATQSLLDFTTIDKEIKNLLVAINTAAGALFSYVLLYRPYEKRKISELSFKNFVKDATLGLLLGLVLQSMVILVISLNGSYLITKINPVLFLLPGMAMALASAVLEEILFRGIIFRLTEEKLGSVIALLISAVIFGGVHLMNKNSTWFSALSIALQAGILLGAAYIFTRNLWLPIFIHFAWNFAEAGIYGAAVSGNEIKKSLITSKIGGPDLITGGAFGPENSIQATIFCSIAAVVLLLLAVKQNKIIKPFWKTKMAE